METDDRKKRAEEEEEKVRDAKARMIEYFGSQKFRERTENTYRDEKANRRRGSRHTPRSVGSTVSSVGREARATDVNLDTTEYGLEPGNIEAYSLPRDTPRRGNSPFAEVYLDDAIANESEGYDTGAVTGHELSHTSYHGSGLGFGNLPFQRRVIRELSNKSGDKSHDPEEVRADINATRVKFSRTGIYDAGKEDFTPEHLDRYKKFLEETGRPMEMSMQRLIEEFGEDGYIRLMNMIAQAPQKNRIPPNAQETIDRLRETDFRPPNVFA
jgi:hypothetical protein